MKDAEIRSNPFPDEVPPPTRLLPDAERALPKAVEKLDLVAIAIDLRPAWARSSSPPLGPGVGDDVNHRFTQGIVVIRPEKVEEITRLIPCGHQTLIIERPDLSVPRLLIILSGPSGIGKRVENPVEVADGPLAGHLAEANLRLHCVAGPELAPVIFVAPIVAFRMNAESAPRAVFAHQLEALEVIVVTIASICPAPLLGHIPVRSLSAVAGRGQSSGRTGGIEGANQIAHLPSKILRQI